MMSSLQIHSSSALTKRESNDDLGEHAATERKRIKEAAVERKKDLVPKSIRQRIRIYCCNCDSKKGAGK